MRIIAAALIVAISWPIAPLQARDVLRLKPASKWILDYAEDNCRLIRGFGEGDQRVSLILDQFEPGDFFRVTFAGEPVKRKRTEGRMHAELRFGPNEAVSDVEAEYGMIGERPALFVAQAQRLAPLTRAEEAAHDRAEKQRIHFEPPPIGDAREAAATWLELKKGLPRDVVLETGPMNKPLAALRKCSWDTVRQWGLNVEQQKTLSRKLHPKGNAARWFSSSDYPRHLLRGGHQGLVHSRIMVDLNGKPTSCHIQLSTRPKEFDDVVCKEIMKHASFEPALDAQGKPVPSYWVQTVNFRIE